MGIFELFKHSDSCGVNGNQSMMQVLQNLRNKDFKMQVWFVTAAVGATRTLKAVIQDMSSAAGTSGLIIDVLILLTFSVLCLLIYWNRIVKVPLVIGLILLILVISSYVRLGGLEGTTEYNLMALGVLFVLVYDRKPLIWLMVAYFVSILAANLDLRFEGWLTKNLFDHVSVKLDNYFTTALALLILVVYFKDALISESRRITELRTRLGGQIATIRKQHQELEEQQQELHEANARLEEEISKHTQHTIRQNLAIENYIRLSTESLHKPLQSINAEIDGLREDNFLENLLKAEVSELHQVVNNIKVELKERETRNG
jgi:hypothetical protein